jgi:hypothetical protein
LPNVDARYREAAVAAVDALLAHADAKTLEGLLRHDLELAFVERNPVESAIGGLSIEEAHSALSAMGAPQLRKFFSAPTLQPRHALPKSVTTKAAIIDLIISEQFGRKYSPPPKVTKPRQGGASKKTSASAKPVGGTIDPAAIVKELRSALTLGEGEAALQLGRAKAPYHAIADCLDIKYTSGTTVKDLVSAILRVTVVARLEHGAYEGLGDR